MYLTCLLVIFFQLYKGAKEPEVLFELYTDVEIVEINYLNKDKKIIYTRNIGESLFREDFNDLSNQILWTNFLQKPFYIKLKKIKEMYETYESLTVEFVTSISNLVLSIDLNEDKWTFNYLNNDPLVLDVNYVNRKVIDLNPPVFTIALKNSVNVLENSVNYCNTLLEIKKELKEVEDVVFKGLLGIREKEEIYLSNRNIREEYDENVISPMWRLYYSIINTRLSYYIPSLRVEKPKLMTFTSFQNNYDQIVDTLIGQSRKYNSEIRQQDLYEMLNIKHDIHQFSSNFTRCYEKFNILIEILKNVKDEDKNNLIVTEKDKEKEIKVNKLSEDFTPIAKECLYLIFSKYGTCMNNFAYRKAMLVEDREVEITQIDIFFDIILEFYLKWWEYTALFDNSNVEELESFYTSQPFRSILKKWIRNYLVREKSKLELLLTHPESIKGRYLKSEYLKGLVERYRKCINDYNCMYDCNKDTIEDDSVVKDKVNFPFTNSCEEDIEKKSVSNPFLKCLGGE